MNKPENSNLLALLGKKNSIIILIILLTFSTVLSIIFVEIEAFEWLYDFSREHEDWELDEIILVALSLLISISVSSLFAAIILSNRLLRSTQKRIKIEGQLSQSRKMQSMGNLLGGISHSMNNHLLPILMITKLVQKELPEDSEEASDLERVISAANGAKMILRRILNFTRQEELINDNTCVIDETVKIAVELASIATPSAINLHLDIPVLSEFVPISRLNLEIITLNLITNSVDAIGAKTGNIYVSLLEAKAKDSPLGIKSACFKVKDDGEGITEEQKVRIFEPFYTSKEAGKGTGLGLSETYGIIASSKGAIEVDSQPGNFTEFTIFLPIVPLT